MDENLEWLAQNTEDPKSSNFEMNLMPILFYYICHVIAK